MSNVPNLNKKEYCSSGNLDPFFPFTASEAGDRYEVGVQLLSLLFVAGEDNIGGAFVLKFQILEADARAQQLGVKVGRTHCHRYALDSDVVIKNMNMQKLRDFLCAVEGADARDESFDANKVRDQLIEASVAEVTPELGLVFAMRAQSRKAKKSGNFYTNWYWNLTAKAA